MGERKVSRIVQTSPNSPPYREAIVFDDDGNHLETSAHPLSSEEFKFYLKPEVNRLYVSHLWLDNLQIFVDDMRKRQQTEIDAQSRLTNIPERFQSADGKHFTLGCCGEVHSIDPEH